MKDQDHDKTRRRLLRGMLGAPLLLTPGILSGVVGCDAADDVNEARAELAPTPACVDGDDDATPAQTEGPYFTPNSPERSSLLGTGVSGTVLVLTGTVFTTGCVPIPSALLDFWQADDDGNYDNSGYKLRGHQFSDADGKFRLETIVPGIYPGRTRHIHVKVQAPNKPVLTTQLYFHGESRNASDGIFREECLIDISQNSEGQEGVFNFVLDVA